MTKLERATVRDQAKWYVREAQACRRHDPDSVVQVLWLEFAGRVPRLDIELEFTRALSDHAS